MAALAPLPKPLGLHANAIAHQPVGLVVQERMSFSGGDFDITDTNGQPVVHCKGKAFSMSQRTEFFAPGAPPNTAPLFTLRKRKISLLEKFYLEDSNEKEILQINRKFSLGRMKMDIVFNNAAADGAEVTLHLKGSWFDRKAEITLNDQPIARIRKNITLGSVLIDKDRYAIELAPGCDVLLFAAIVVAIDEAHRDEKN